ISQLQTACPDKLTLLGVCPGSRDDEAALHERLALFHLRGEWFRCTPELLAIVEEVCHGHRLRGRCPRCGKCQVPLQEDAEGADEFVCLDCDPPGLPKTLRRSKHDPDSTRRIPSGGGYRILRKGFK